MLESVVERLLSRYLAPYVLGISKEKLSVAVWSGNVALSELHVKPEISDLLGIPFKVVWGRIGRITLNIPWASLGSSPVSIDIQDVYLLLEPKPIPQLADAELQQQLRSVKMQQVEACEVQLREVRQQLQQQMQQQTGKDAEGGFFFRLANKILSTLQVSVKGIHVALMDRQRGFRAGVVLESLSLQSTDMWATGEGQQQQQQQQQQDFYKTCELKGLAAYCELHSCGGSTPAAAAAAAADTPELLLEEEPEVDAELELGNSPDFSEGPQVRASPTASSRESEDALPEKELVVNPELHDEDLQAPQQDTSEHQEQQGREEDRETKVGPKKLSVEGPIASAPLSRESSRKWKREGSSTAPPPRKIGTHAEASRAGRAGGLPQRVRRGRNRYILKPLHLRLNIAHAATRQEFSARLEVLQGSHGAAIGKSQLAVLLQLMHEAGERRRRCERLLLREAHTVALAPEDLENNGKTQKEFTALYGRQLQAEEGIKGVQPLSESEERRLRVLYDVVGVRHLAKWRSICREATSRVMAETQKVQEQRQPKPPPKSWWQWATRSDQQQQGEEQEKGEEEPLITQEDIQIIMDSVQNDETLQGMGLPSSYHLSFDLLQFRVSLEDDAEGDLEAAAEDEETERPPGGPPDLPEDFPLPPRDSPTNSPPDVHFAEGAAGTGAAAAGNTRTGEEELSFLSLSLSGMRASLDCCNRQDYSGEDNAEWAFSFSLADFTVRQKQHTLMHFRSETDSSSSGGFGKTHVGLFGDTGKLIHLPSAIFRAAPTSLAAAQFLLQHRLTPHGNILGVSVHLAPLVASVRPDILKTIGAFFVFETPEDIRRLQNTVSAVYSQEARGGSAAVDPAAGGTSAAALDEEEPEQLQRDLGAMHVQELVEGLREKGETVYAAAVHRLPGLLQLELNIAAPIFHLDSLGSGSVAVHLGRLTLKTDGPCPYGALRAVLELNETRLLCSPKGGREVSLLRPIPIRVHLQVEAATRISMDLEFDDIFIEATPEAVALLLAVPVSLAKSVVQPALPSAAAGAPATTYGAALRGAAAADAPQDMDEQKTPRQDKRAGVAAASALETLRGIPAALRTTQSGDSSSSSSSSHEGGGFVIASTWRFSRCGFIVHRSSSTEEKGVLRAQLSALEITVGADTGVGTCNISAALRDVFVSDPSTESLLFQSLNKQPSCESPVSSQPSASMERFKSAISHTETLTRQLESFQDALDDSGGGFGDDPEEKRGGGAADARSLRLALNYKRGADPQTRASLVVLPAEVHWRQESLRRVLETAQVYRHQLDQQLATAAATFSRPPFLSESAFAALQDALQAMQSSLNTGDAKAEAKFASVISSLTGNSSSGTSSSSSSSDSGGVKDDSSSGVQWLRSGLEVGGDMPPLAALVGGGGEQQQQLSPEPSSTISNIEGKGPLPVSVSLDLTVQGAAVSFWDGRSVYCRVGVRDVCVSLESYPNGDSETFLSIRHAAVILNDRCVLAPRENEQQPLLDKQQQHDQQEKQQDSLLVALKIRQYGGGEPGTGRPLPFSVCVSGRVSQLCLVYIHQDIQAFLDYLRDGIFDIFISKSYEAVKQAATGSRSLFALHIDCPLFIVPENKAAIPELQQQLRREQQRQQQLSPRPESEAESVALAAASGKVELKGLGRFLIFSAGILRVSNAYTLMSAANLQSASLEQRPHRDNPGENLEGGCINPRETGSCAVIAAQQEDAGSCRAVLEPGNTSAVAAAAGGAAAKEEEWAFDLKLDFSGMQLSARDNEDIPLGEIRAREDRVSVEGEVLKTANVGVRLQCSNRVSVAAHTSPWLLHLSREQLTLFLDVLNENITGGGYEPRQPAAAAAERLCSASDNNTRGYGQGDTTDAWNIPLQMPSQQGDLEVPLHVDFQLCVPKLLLETSMGPRTPLALMTVHRIAVFASASSSTQTGTQLQLNATGDVFAVDDIRPQTANYYRRLAHCTGGPLEEPLDGPLDGGCLDAQAAEGCDTGDAECWSKSDADEDADCLPAVSLHLETGTDKGVVDVVLRDVTLYTLVVGFGDLGKYFSTAYACSTMKRFPKPQPLVSEQQKQQQIQQQQQQQHQDNSRQDSHLGPRTVSRSFEGRAGAEALPTESQTCGRSGDNSTNTSCTSSNNSTTISLRICNGQFVVYTDIESPTAPLIVWSGDLFVSLLSEGVVVSLQHLEIQHSKVSRLEAAPSEGELAASSSSSRSRSMSASYLRAASTRLGHQKSAESGGQLSPQGIPLSLAGSIRQQQLALQQQQQQQGDDTYGEENLLIGEWPEPSRLIPSMLTEGAVLLCEDLSVRGKGIFLAAATDEEVKQQEQQEQQQGETEEEDADSDAEETDEETPPPPAPATGESRMAAVQRAFAGAAAAATAAAAAAAAEAPRALTTRQPKPLTSAVASGGGTQQANRLTTKVRMQLIVPKFFLRVSSNDIALLLNAVRGLSSDGPTVCGLQDQSVSSPAAASAKAAAPQNPTPSNIKQQEPTCPVDEHQQDSELALEQDVRVSVQLAGVELLLLDDLRASVVPLLQLQLSVGQLRGRVSGRHLVLSLIDLRSSCSFLNVKSGTWEPFIEQLELTVVYRRDLVLEQKLNLAHQQRLTGNSSSSGAAGSPAAAAAAAAAPDQWTDSKAARALLISSYSSFLLNLTPQLCRLLSWFVPYLVQHLQEGPTKGTVSSLPSRTASIGASGTGTQDSRYPEGSPESDDARKSWQASSTPAPFSPLSKSAVAAAARGYAADAAAAVAAAQQQQSSGAPFRYLNLTGEFLYAFTLVSEQPQQGQHQQQPQQQPQQQKQQHRQLTQQQQHEHSQSEQQMLREEAEEAEESETTGAVMVLQVGGSKSLPLEALMEGKTAESSRTAERRQQVFFSTCVPVTTVQQASEVLPHVPRTELLRSLLLTRDAQRTIGEFLDAEHTQPAAVPSADETKQQKLQRCPRRCVGPFPQGMQAVLVEAMKSHSVSLLLPQCTQEEQEVPPPPLQQQRTARPVSSLEEMRSKSKFGAAHVTGGGDTLLPESIPLGATRTLASPMKQQQMQGSSGAEGTPSAASGTPSASHWAALELKKDFWGGAVRRGDSRRVSSELVAQVLSPHPSYKLVLLTSTVLLQNRSGLPLEVCFLDQRQRPLLLPAAAATAAPLSVLQEQPDTQAAGGIQSFQEVTLLDPQLKTIPQWMLDRQERQQQQRMQELALQQELLWQLQRTASGKTGRSTSTTSSGSPQLRRITTQGRSFFSPQHQPEKQQQQLRQQSKLAYTFLLPNQHFMSVPQDAILGAGWVFVCFRPAAFATGRKAGESGEEPLAPPDMGPYTGWSDCIDTRSRVVDCQCMHCAYLPPEERSTASLSGSAAAAAGGAAGGDDALAAASMVKKEKCLFFHLLQEDHKTALPAERLLRTLTVFPALTLMNATLTELDVCMLPSAAASGSSVPLKRPPPASALQRLQQLQQQPVFQGILTRQSVFYVYEVPPSRQLSLWLRFAVLEDARWSPPLRNFLSSEEGLVSRVQLPSASLATVELEVLHDAAEVAPYVPLVSAKQLIAVVSAPRLFIDRTGLKIKPIQAGRYFPDFGGYALLGDSTTPELSLFTVPRGSTPVECCADVPALHGFSKAELAAPSSLYTLCLKTDQLALAHTAGALCRVVSLVPEFLLTNCLQQPVYLRQDRTQGPLVEVKPGETHPVYWPQQELPQHLQFVVGRCSPSGWSGPVVASEETAGRTWVAVPSSSPKPTQPDVYAVDVAPEGGAKSIAIRASDTGGAFVVRNCCPTVQRVMVHTFHSEMNSSSSSRQTGRPPEADCHFFAYEGQSVVYGWPFPFLYKSRPCQVLLWLDSKTVAPRRPILFDMAHPQHKRYEVLLGMPDVGDIVVTSEKFGDDTIIAVLPKDAKMTKELLPATQQPPAQSTPADVGLQMAETSFASFDLAVKLKEIGVSLICDSLAEELCYASLSQVAVGLQQRGDREKVVLRIERIQVDNQMENGNKPVVIANRGGRSVPSHEPTSWGASPPAMPRGSNPFLTVFVVRLNSGSRDIVLKRALVDIDDLEIDIDADMLNGLNDFVWSCLMAFGLAEAASRRAVSLEELGAWVQEPLALRYSPPPLPTILSLESLVISRFRVYCWCSFVLDKMHMISDLLKLGLRILMASGRLELTGARLTFSQEEFRYLRGTVASFTSCLQERYTYHLLSSLFASLGQSSLLNLPRMPYEFGRNTIGLAANAVDSVSTGLGSLLSTFTFDSEYINRRRRERGRGASGMREGFLSAGKSIGEGVWALSSIVTKPLEGAQKEGVGGFLKGIGKGLMGSLVKPLDKVGQAVSDVTRGIQAEVSRPLGALKVISTRHRQPRMVGEQGQVRPYDETEAQLRQSLGLAVLRPMQKCMTVLRHEKPDISQLVVLFYPQDIFLVSVKGNDSEKGVQSRYRGRTSTPLEAGVHIMWHVSVAEIQEVRTDSRGVTLTVASTEGQRQPEAAALGRAGSVRMVEGRQSPQPATAAAAAAPTATTTQTYFIPCQDSTVSNEVYRELRETQRGCATVVHLGTNKRVSDADS